MKELRSITRLEFDTKRTHVSTNCLHKLIDELKEFRPRLFHGLKT